MSMDLWSTAFESGGLIPPRFTCDGLNHSPPLAWAGIPTASESLLVTLTDPDAPGGNWVHWTLFDIDPDRLRLSEGVNRRATQEGIGVQGLNSYQQVGYGGPCPPWGREHRYVFQLYALKKKSNLPGGVPFSILKEYIAREELSLAQLMGRYGRGNNAHSP